MRRTATLGLCLVSAVALSACHRGAGMLGGGDARVCTPFTAVVTPAATTPGAPLASTPVDTGAAVDDCLHRWSYILAKSRDPADIVGRAAVAACASSLSAWNQQALGQADAISSTTGQTVNAMSAHGDYAQGRALFYVVQARAGNCAPPPAVKTATR